VTNQNAPLPLKVSVSKTDSINGIIDLSWTKPYNLDSIKHSPPYKYIIKRGTGLNPELFDVIHTSGDLEDTVFTDSLLNTHLPYSYTIEFYDASGFYASSNQASTVNLSVTP